MNMVKTSRSRRQPWTNVVGVGNTRCRVPMEISGGNQSLQIVMTTPDVEQLTGITAEQLRDSDEFLPQDFNVQDDLQATLDKLDVVCFIKKYDPTTLGTPNSASIRYTVVKAYPIDAMKKPHASSPSASAPAKLALPADDIQFFSPFTKKNLTEIETLPTPNKAEQSTPPSKRSLQFMSSRDKPLPANQSAGTSTDPNQAASPEKSPAKKGKDKQDPN